MKFKMTALALLLIASAARAEWLWLGGTDHADYYIDRTTIRHTGELAEAWTLTNLIQRDLDGEMSRSQSVQYDCQNGLYRFLNQSFYNGSMATGEVVRSATGSSFWIPIAKKTFGKTEFQAVCAR